MAKKNYEIPIAWQCYGKLQVEAESLQEAVDIANRSPLPDGDYVMDSEEIDVEILESDYPGESFKV